MRAVKFREKKRPSGARSGSTTFSGMSVANDLFNPDPGQADTADMVDVDLAMHWQQFYLGAVILADFNWANLLPL